jgi:hypothetical protein
VQASRARAARILPVPSDLDAAACAAWIREHKKDLSWAARVTRQQLGESQSPIDLLAIVERDGLRASRRLSIPGR